MKTYAIVAALIVGAGCNGQAKQVDEREVVTTDHEQRITTLETEVEALDKRTSELENASTDGGTDGGGGETGGGGSAENLLWVGDFETGDFTQWPHTDDSLPDDLTFPLIPEYGRPIQYGHQRPDTHVGDGSLLEIVNADGAGIYNAGPVACGKYAAKFTIKNGANDSEPADCDASKCDRRRSELGMVNTYTPVYDGFPPGKERWFSFSVYIPASLDIQSGGWAVIGGVKNTDGSGSGIINFEIYNDEWSLWHRWSATATTSDNWRHAMYYRGNHDGRPYPRDDFWPEGLAHFPNAEDSVAALHSVARDVWTDWVVHILPDHRASGSGFLEIYKREDGGDWIEVLDIRPGPMTRGNENFDMGIGYNQTTGYAHVFGLYGDKVSWSGAATNQSVYFDCHKGGNELATFADMSPDGSVSGD